MKRILIPIMSLAVSSYSYAWSVYFEPTVMMTGAGNIGLEIEQGEHHAIGLSLSMANSSEFYFTSDQGLELTLSYLTTQDSIHQSTWYSSYNLSYKRDGFTGVNANSVMGQVVFGRQWAWDTLFLRLDYGVQAGWATGLAEERWNAETDSYSYTQIEGDAKLGPVANFSLGFKM